MPLEAKALDGSEHNLSLLKNASLESILEKVKNDRISKREKGFSDEYVRREVGIPMEVDLRFDVLINKYNTNMSSFCVGFTEYSWYEFLIILNDNSIDLKELYKNHDLIKRRGGRDAKLSIFIRRRRIDAAFDLSGDMCYFDRKIYSQIKKLSKYLGSDIASLIRILWYVGIQKLEREEELKGYTAGSFTYEIETFIEYQKSRSLTAEALVGIIEKNEGTKLNENTKSDKK